MALATRCPSCATVFRISTMQAAAKSGMVRCGACRHVFNSLDALVRVEDLDLQDESLGADHHASRQVQAVRTAESGNIRNSSASIDSEPANLSEPATEAKDVVFEDWPPLEPGHTLHERAPALPSASPIEEPKRDVAAPRLGERRLDLRWPRPGSAGDRIGEPAFMRSGERPPRSRTERTLLSLLSLLAAVGLALQLIYVWRTEVAARWPVVKPWLTSACVPLRCQVDFPARLDEISIESSSLQNAPGTRDAYVFTALLRNRAHVAVRYPALELTLTDTQDQALVRRILRPEDYLSPEPGKRRIADAGSIAPNSELPVRVTFETAGLRAAGYRAAVFYP